MSSRQAGPSPASASATACPAECNLQAGGRATRYNGCLQLNLPRRGGEKAAERLEARRAKKKEGDSARRPMPRKIRQLIADLERAGWRLEEGGKGSHRKFAHARSQRKVMLSGAGGADAHYYQEKLVKDAIREVHL